MKGEPRTRSARLAANICECVQTAKYAPFPLNIVRGTRERARIPAGIRPIVERYGSRIQMKTNQFSIGYEIDFHDAFPACPALRDNAIKTGQITGFSPLFPPFMLNLRAARRPVRELENCNIRIHRSVYSFAVENSRALLPPESFRPCLSIRRIRVRFKKSPNPGPGLS
ncbi:hypothetical protein [Burkholderia stagnalis]|uniref:hypothetical protein n=1 Tax=Burkholderia stagnalis TaxID=1503054 RepID=UPI000F80C2F3|nr:hypothetical protein [Burkholderia stagnalis]